MQHHHISPLGDPKTCIFCKGTMPRGATVWRAGHPHHAICLVRTLVSRSRPWGRRTLQRGLLPAGKDRDARRTDLYKNDGATTEVGGDA
jgi:hypothetical protein